MDLINSSIITAVSAVVGVILGKQPLVNVFDFFQRRKLKNALNILETHSMFDKFEDDFKSKFIISYLKELYFVTQTGIDTNEKSISKYIDFKNKLGANYTWKEIKNVKQHLDLNSNDIKIKLSKYERFYVKFTFICFPIFLLIGVITFFFLNQFRPQGIKEIFIVLASLIIPAICGYLFVATANSIFIAERMEKRLNNLQ